MEWGQFNIDFAAIIRENTGKNTQRYRDIIRRIVAKNNP
jgi:hypothetical protein